jgi:hypothetical protein
MEDAAIDEARRVQEFPREVNAAVKFHALCAACKSLCDGSPLLNGTFQGKYPWESQNDPPFDNTSSDPDLQRFKFEGEYLLHRSVAELEASVTAGCHLCSLFWHNINYEVYYKLEEEKEIELRDYAKRIKQGARDFLRALDGGPGDMRPFVAVRVGSGSPGGGPRGVMALYACLGSGRALPQVRSTLLIMDTKFIDSCMYECVLHSQKLTVSSPQRNSWADGSTGKRLHGIGRDLRFSEMLDFKVYHAT